MIASNRQIFPSSHSKCDQTKDSFLPLDGSFSPVSGLSTPFPTKIDPMCSSSTHPEPAMDIATKQSTDVYSSSTNKKSFDIMDTSTHRPSHNAANILDFAQNIKLSSFPTTPIMHGVLDTAQRLKLASPSTCTKKSSLTNQGKVECISIEERKLQELPSEKESLTSALKADLKTSSEVVLPSKKRERSESLDFSLLEQLEPPTSKSKSAIPRASVQGDEPALSKADTSLTKLFNEVDTICNKLERTDNILEMAENIPAAPEEFEPEDVLPMDFDKETAHESTCSSLYNPIATFSTERKNAGSILDIAQSVPAPPPISSDDCEEYCPKSLAEEFGLDLPADESESFSCTMFDAGEDEADDDDISCDRTTSSLQETSDGLLSMIQGLLLGEDIPLPSPASCQSLSVEALQTADRDSAEYDVEPTPLLESDCKPKPTFATVPCGFVSEDFPSAPPPSPTAGEEDVWFDNEEDAMVDYVPSQVLQDQNTAPLRRLHESMARTAKTMEDLQEWDRANGLPKSHCQTMVNTSRSREQLQSGLVLQKWNGVPLLKLPGAKVKVTRRVFRGNKITEVDETQGDRIAQAA